MKDQHQTAIEHLKHALVWIREARDAEFDEIREQHLNEAERLIEYAKGLLDGKAKRG
jgi:hypothetical protein